MHTENHVETRREETVTFSARFFTERPDAHSRTPQDQILRESRAHRVEALKIMHVLELAIFAIMLVYAILDGRSQDIFMLSAFLACTVAITPFVLRYAEKTALHITLVTVIGLAILCAAWHGGIENTGFLWLFLYPSFAMYMLGLRLGLCFAVGEIVLGSAVLFLATVGGLVPAIYNIDMVLRVIALYVVTLALTIVYERARSKNYMSVRRLNERISVQAATDELTGLLNRRSFKEVMTQFREPVSLVMMDIDHFKDVNDLFGHGAGDMALRRIADTLRRGLRRDDVISRWGGEEFLIALPGSDAFGAHCVAEQLRTRVEATVFSFSHNGSMKTSSITASFGIAGPEESKDLEKSIELADSRLYQAKELGRNRVIGSSELAGCGF